MIIIKTTDIENDFINKTYSTCPDQCPFCHIGIKPIVLNAYMNCRISELQQDSISRVIFKCPRTNCDNIFIGIYEFTYDHSFDFHFSFLFSYPVFPIKKEFSIEIEQVSLNFVEIYNQAYSAEQTNLLLVAGPGYRKALEFLIKDYVIKITDDSDHENILKCPLVTVINNYIDDKRIKSMATRAAWLGNDETHYYSKWKNKDLVVLKSLIELTVRWIEINLLSDKFEDDMPD